MNYPSTIHHKDAFERSKSAGFDGVFDWSWTQGCFGETKITPMDFDGVVERNGQFLIFETKGIDAPIKQGQFITLAAAHKLGCFSILLIEGKHSPCSGVLFAPKHTIPRQTFTDGRIRIRDLDGGLRWQGVLRAKELCAAWYKWADGYA